MKDKGKEARVGWGAFRWRHRSDNCEWRKGRKEDWVGKASDHRAVLRKSSPVWEGDPHKGCLLEKSHVGQEWPGSKTPIILRQWLKMTLGKLDPQWIRRNSIWGYCLWGFPWRFTWREIWVVNFSGLPNQFIDTCWKKEWVGKFLNPMLETPSWSNWTNCLALQLFSCRADLPGHHFNG